VTDPDLLDVLAAQANRAANQRSAARLLWLGAYRLMLRRGPAGLDLDHAMAGARRADDNADDWWRSTALAGIEALAASGREFTADDLRALGVVEPDHPGRWGGLFLGCSRTGLIVPVGAQRATRGPRKGSLLRIWRGAE
jgi:hypothetical protein